MRRTLLLLCLSLVVGTASHAQAVPPAAVALKMRDSEATAVLNRALTEPTFWADAKLWQYAGRMYDEVRLKPLGQAYVPMISGESDENIPRESVAEIVFHQQNRLPNYMDGAVAVVNLGTGTDSVTGVAYQDTYFLLDLTFFYGWFFQRMYRVEEPTRSVLAFEKLTSKDVDAATWASYSSKATAAYEAAPKGSWLRLLADQEVTSLYGMFVVSRGNEKESRVTFVSKLGFGGDSSWVAQAGSKMPGVIRSGLEHGFDASVLLAKRERDRRAKLPPPAPTPVPAAAPGAP